SGTKTEVEAAMEKEKGLSKKKRDKADKLPFSVFHPGGDESDGESRSMRSRSRSVLSSVTRSREGSTSSSPSSSRASSASRSASTVVAAASTVTSEMKDVIRSVIREELRPTMDTVAKIFESIKRMERRQLNDRQSVESISQTLSEKEKADEELNGRLAKMQSD
ncbi:hypothetical protein PFISCL1PPCAC_18225, partial [Pristionchus fissidentatus]